MDQQEMATFIRSILPKGFTFLECGKTEQFPDEDNSFVIAGTELQHRAVWLGDTSEETVRSHLEDVIFLLNRKEGRGDMYVR